MNLEYRHDRVGPDHKLRNDFRNFLLVYHNSTVKNSALIRLGDKEEVSAIQVRDELAKLVEDGYSIDYVYQFSTEDIRKFLEYTEFMIVAEKALVALEKAVKLAYDAGITHDIFQGELVDFYQELQDKDRPFVNRWDRRY